MKIKLSGQTVLVNEENFSLAHKPVDGKVIINGVEVKDGEEAEI